MIKIKATFDPGDVLKRLEQAKQNTLDQIGAELLLNFYAVTATYSHQVVFRVQKAKDRHAVGTDDPIFVENNDGFTRFVTLSSDFQRKTMPGVLAAFPGAGRVVGFTPFGIKVPAGNWDEANEQDVTPQAGPIANQEYVRLL